MAEMEVVIVGAARTPVGSLNGSLSSLAGHELGAAAIGEALRRAKAAPESVSEVIMGQVLIAGEPRVCSHLLAAACTRVGTESAVSRA